MPKKIMRDTTDLAEEPQAEALPEINAIQASPELQNLLNSAMATIEDGTVVWREGHLEHVARQYVADPVTTEQRYHDDLSVARQYSRELFDKLVAEASSQ